MNTPQRHAPRPEDIPQDTMALWRRLVRAPTRIGALTPSSPYCARSLAAAVPRQARVVVDLGAGTGVVSDALAERLSERARILAVEADPGLVAHLRGTRGWLDVAHAEARDLRQLLVDRRLSTVDALVCTVPLSFADDRDETLDELVTTLRPGGVFVALLTCTGVLRRCGRATIAAIRERFAGVTVRATWRYLAPGVMVTGHAPGD